MPWYWRIVLFRPVHGHVRPTDQPVHPVQVAGAAERLLTIARERVKDGDFRTGETEELPYENQTFDLVAGFNSFQFATSPVNALCEASRVSRKGIVVIADFGKPEENESTAFIAALGALLSRKEQKPRLSKNRATNTCGLMRIDLVRWSIAPYGFVHGLLLIKWSKNLSEKASGVHCRLSTVAL